MFCPGLVCVSPLVDMEKEADRPAASREHLSVVLKQTRDLFLKRGRVCDGRLARKNKV